MDMQRNDSPHTSMFAILRAKKYFWHIFLSELPATKYKAEKEPLFHQVYKKICIPQKQVMVTLM